MKNPLKHITCSQGEIPVKTNKNWDKLGFFKSVLHDLEMMSTTICVLNKTVLPCCTLSISKAICRSLILKYATDFPLTDTSTQAGSHTNENNPFHQNLLLQTKQTKEMSSVSEQSVKCLFHHAAGLTCKTIDKHQDVALSQSWYSRRGKRTDKLQLIASWKIRKEGGGNFVCQTQCVKASEKGWRMFAMSPRTALTVSPTPFMARRKL